MSIVSQSQDQQRAARVARVLKVLSGDVRELRGGRWLTTREITDETPWGKPTVMHTLELLRDDERVEWRSGHPNSFWRAV